MLAVLPMSAQKGMHVETLFDGRFKYDKRAVEVLIKGKELKKYHLTLFRSLTVTDAPALSDEIEAKLVRSCIMVSIVSRHRMKVTDICSTEIPLWFLTMQRNRKLRWYIWKDRLPWKN